MSKGYPFPEPLAFQWDSGNINKNRDKHGVGWEECEQMFFNRPVLVLEDAAHSLMEARFFALGKSDSGRMLFAVFTMRGGLVRVISARDMSRKERSYYEQATEKDS